jgi:hypothetical protein
MHRIRKEKEIFFRDKRFLCLSLFLSVCSSQNPSQTSSKSACGSRNAISNGSSENDERKGKGRSSMMRARRDPCL